MTFEDRLTNATATTVLAADRIDDEGRDVLIVASKLSLRYDLRGALRLTARPIRQRSELDEAGGVRFPHDLPLDRPGTDVLLVGSCLPGRTPATSRLISLAVGPVKKSIRVHGPRVWMKSPLGVRPGPPAAIVATPLRFDHVFGGRDADAYDARNPIGRGFATNPDTLIGEEAPRLEPADLTALAPTSGCFAPIDNNWEPRRAFAGTYDDAWRAKRGPIAPRDRDARFHADALPEQRSSRPLTTPLPVEILGLYGDEALRFTLPSYSVLVTTEVGEEPPADVAATLVRVLIDADARVVELLHVARRRLPRKWEALRAIRVTTPSSLPDAIRFHEGPPDASGDLAPLEVL
jgi:hypothetical protein